MIVLCFLQLYILQPNNYSGIKGLLGAFNNLMENELKMSMLDSPDHCEGTLKKETIVKEDSDENDRSSKPSKEETKRNVALILDEIQKIKSKRIAKEISDSEEDENLKRNKINGMKLQNEIDAYNLQNRIIDKIKDQQNKRMHEPQNDNIVVPGKPRKVKVVKIIPVDENGEEIKMEEKTPN